MKDFYIKKYNYSPYTNGLLKSIEQTILVCENKIDSLKGEVYEANNLRSIKVGAQIKAFKSIKVTLLNKRNKIIKAQKDETAFATLSVEEALKKEWVSVDDDTLPPMDVNTMIILEGGDIHLGYYDGADNEGKDRWFCDNNDYHYPTHWTIPTAPNI